jgi:hypothetical protein
MAIRLSSLGPTAFGLTELIVGFIRLYHPLACLSLLAVAVIDLVRARREWVHWVGVTLVAGDALLNVVVYVWQTHFMHA